MMDLNNIIDNSVVPKMTDEFNSCELNFQEKNIDDIKIVDEVSAVNSNVEKQSMVKQMFSLLADYNVVDVINTMARKYGSFFDEKCISLCKKVGDLIGNYLITCKYNDNFGKKNKSFVKYVILCDCDGDDQITEQHCNGGSVDGFFGDAVQKVSKNKMCKKHHLPVLANISDLSQEDFSQLAKKLSQVKNIQQKIVLDGTDKKANVATKIAKMFKNIVPKKSLAKVSNQQYKLKDANIEVTANIGKKFESAQVKDVEPPKPENMKYKVAKQVQEADVNMPVNSVSVNVNKQAKSMKQFTVTPNKCDKVEVAKNVNSNVNIPGKNIAVAVQKQSKFVDNISIYTKPIKTEFDLEDDYSFDLNNEQAEDIQIDPKGSFDF